MTLQLTSDQPSIKKHTMWDALAQVTSLVGGIESEHPFTNDFSCQVPSRIARGLGTLMNGP